MKKIIGICIPTYKRLEKLEKLIQSLEKQRYDQSNIETKIIVVDNDLDGSAQKITNKYNSIAVYSIEKNKGVASVRNKCIDICIHLNYDYIAFIDDDEVASETWINNIYLSLKKYNADVVAGPVIATYNIDTPKWIIEGEFFERQRHNSGKELIYCGTGNLLIKISIINKLNMKFDPLFNKSGGEDTDFFMKLNKQKGRIVWCNEAIVYEEVDLQRCNKKWLFERAYCGGSNYALCERKYSNNKIQIISRLIKGSIHIMLGIANLLISYNSKIKIIKARMKIKIGIGQIVGVLGINKGEQY